MYNWINKLSKALMAAGLIILRHPCTCGIL